MKKKRIALAVLTLSVVFAVSLRAETTPNLINYQCLLTDSVQTPLNGDYDLTFRVYDAETGGSQLWSETHTDVSIDNGRASVNLGSVSALNLDFQESYWITLEVNSDGEMSPRQRMTSGAYAYKTKISDSALNAMTTGSHASLSHASIPAVKANTVDIAKTNFKVDAYTQSSANLMNDLVIDTFQDTTGIDTNASSGYQYRSTECDFIFSDGMTNPNEISDDLVSYWRLNESNGAAATDYYGSNNLSSVNSVGESADVPHASIASSREFSVSQNNYFTITHAGQQGLSFTNAFTFAGWIKATSVPNVWILTSKSAGGNLAYTFCLLSETDSTQPLGLRILLSSSGSGWNLNLTGTSALSLNQWHHVAVTYDGISTVCTIYVDGSVYASSSGAPSSLFQSTADYYFGAYPGAYSADAVLSEFGVWERSLTSQEIADLATTVAGGSEADIRSVSFSLSHVPDEAMIIPDASLYGSSMTYYVSRDDGTTWTECASNQVADISSQPEGSSLRWRTVINGSAELNAIGVSVN